MKRYLGVLLFVLVAGSVAAWAARYDADQRSGLFTGEKPVQLSFGKAVQVSVELRRETFFERAIINANATVRNSSRVPMFYHYHIAFFDRAGVLLGCASQGVVGDSGLAAGKEARLGSCLVHLPAAERAKVASYRIAFYESDKPIGD